MNNDFEAEIIEIVDDEIPNYVLINQIINFLKSEAGIFMLKMIKETKDNRVEDLIYATKDNIFNMQGEVLAYTEILAMFTEKELKKLADNMRLQK